MNTTIFIKGLSLHSTAKDVGLFFEKYGKVNRCDIPFTKGASKGYAFVEFEQETDAIFAIGNAKDSSLAGKKLFVQKVIREPTFISKFTPYVQQDAKGTTLPPSSSNRTRSPPPMASRIATARMPPLSQVYHNSTHIEVRDHRNYRNKGEGRDSQDKRETRESGDRREKKEYGIYSRDREDSREKSGERRSDREMRISEQRDYREKRGPDRERRNSGERPPLRYRERQDSIPRTFNKESSGRRQERRERDRSPYYRPDRSHKVRYRGGNKKRDSSGSRSRSRSRSRDRGGNRKRDRSRSRSRDRGGDREGRRRPSYPSPPPRRR